MKYPDFLIIGAARSGTSSLHKNLESHPQIIGPRLLGGNHKEAHFFDKSVKFNRGISWYLSLWPDVSGVLRFESTPNYLYVKEVPKRVKDKLENWESLKFIIMLRDPVLRAWSHYWHWREKHGESQEALMDPKSIYVEKGLYHEQLSNWHYHFEKSQFLIIQSEKFFEDPRAVIMGVHKWLGIENIYPHSPVYFDPKKRNQHIKKGYEAIPDEVKNWLSRYYKPYNKDLFAYLGREFGGWL